MTSFDPGTIVPSTRDLLQALARRRKGLAVIALLGPGAPPKEHAARLDQASVAAFAFDEPGPLMHDAARSTKTIPSLCLRPVRDRDGYLEARFHGADGICIEPDLPADAWKEIARGAQGTRMLALGFAENAASAAALVERGARALVLRARSVEEIAVIAATLPKTITLIGAAASLDEASLRALSGHVDAAVVPPTLHAAAGFAELVAEIDP